MDTGPYTVTTTTAITLSQEEEECEVRRREERRAEEKRGKGKERFYLTLIQQALPGSEWSLMNRALASKNMSRGAGCSWGDVI